MSQSLYFSSKMACATTLIVALLLATVESTLPQKLQMRSVNLADETNLADLLLGQHFEGQYTSSQSSPLFSYLDSKSGTMEAFFYSDPTKMSSGAVDQIEIFIFDPIYHDEKAVGILIGLKKDIVNGSTWMETNTTITTAKFWKQRKENEGTVDMVNYTITLLNKEATQTEQVSFEIVLAGADFQVVCRLAYVSQTVSTIGYCLFVTFMVGIQIFAAFRILRSLDGGNPGLLNKISLLTLSICNIQDFNMTMKHIEYIMSTGSAYLFFILPSMAFIVLFVIFDMKMLFIVWRSHHLRDLENPQMLRKKLTAFYIQFYLGLFLYLTLNYFFSFDGWLILLQTLVMLPQIVRNTRLGNNSGFPKNFILGYLASRMLLPIYERTCPSNHFLLSPDLALTVCILCIFGFQVLLLWLQHRLGARFFVPKLLLPNYYQYTTKLKINEQNSDRECSICMQNMFASESAINDSLSTELMSEVTAMRTPCNHYFHRECLSQWMDVKLECPTCRAVLPPI